MGSGLCCAAVCYAGRCLERRLSSSPLVLCAPEVSPVSQWETTSNAAPPPPRASLTSRAGFNPSMVDFGPVFWRQEFNDYLLLHGGADGFTVQRIVSSCGCTLIDGQDELIGRVVPSEDVLPLSVAFHTGDVPGPKLAVVQIAASNGQVFTAEIRAQVVGTWDVSATSVRLPNPWGAAESSRASLAVSADDDQLSIDVEPLASWLTCEIERRRGGAVLWLAADSERVPPGKSSSWLAITTNDPIVDRRLVEVSVDAHFELTAHPPRVFLRPGDCWTVRFRDELRRDAVLEPPAVRIPGVRATRIGPAELRVCADQAFEDGQFIMVRDDHGRRGIVGVCTLE